MGSSFQVLYTTEDGKIKYLFWKPNVSYLSLPRCDFGILKVAYKIVDIDLNI